MTLKIVLAIALQGLIWGELALAQTKFAGEYNRTHKVFSFDESGKTYHTVTDRLQILAGKKGHSSFLSIP